MLPTMDSIDAEFNSFLNKCTDSWSCPLCAEKGVTARVRLHQANSHQAIYLCENKYCLYPLTDDADPVIVSRSLVELPVDGPTLEKFGFPPTLLDEGQLTLKDLYELCLIHDAYKEYDNWARAEKEVELVQNMLNKECEKNSMLEKVRFNPKCTHLNYLRKMPQELIKYVRHFIPNIDEIIELLSMDLL